MRVQIFRVTVNDEAALAAALVGDRMVQARVPLATLAACATPVEQRQILAAALRARLGPATPEAAEIVRLAGVVELKDEELEPVLLKAG
jgi:hypothetical protein